MNIRPRRSMAFFAILTMVMVITSYLFVLLLAAACVVAPCWLLMVAGTANLQIALLLLFGIAVAGAILWSLVPRFETFKAPGLLLNRAEQPRLFAEIDRIASALQEPVPQEVYLIGDVNAWVAHRGGFMGFGSRRIMGLGLPLLSVLTVSQLRAVLAHEFAHYYGGDTSLGPWVYRAQTTIARSFRNVGALGHLTHFIVMRMMYEVVTTLMRWHFMIFLRAIHGSSRMREYRADELACLIAGRQALVGGLRAINGAAPAWEAFWKTELSPVLSDGFCPGILEGFARFVSVPGISEQIRNNLETQIREEKTNPYATHPPLRKRIAALERISVDPVPDDSAPARDLLAHASSVEVRFLERANPAMKPGALTSIPWKDVASKVVVPRWRKAAAAHASLLEGFSPQSLPDRIARSAPTETALRDSDGKPFDPAQRNTAQIFGVGLALFLIDQGWIPEVGPGEFHLHHGPHRLNPFLAVHELMTGRMSAPAWQERCRTWEATGQG